MSIQGVNQNLRVYVSPASAATEPTTPANGTVLDYSGVGAGTGLPLGGITYRSIAAVRDDATIPAVDFQVVYKDMNGVVYFSPVIRSVDIIKKDLARAAVSPTQQISNLTIATATEGANYVIRLTVPGYGGLLGAQDEVNFYGMHTASGADTVTTIGTALYNSLKKACDKAPVAFAAVTNPSAGKITVTGVAQAYVQAKWSGRQVNFALSLAQPTAQVAGDDGDTTVPVVGNGQYNQVAGLEEFYAGENRGYANRFNDWPYMTEPVLAAEVGAEYTSDTIIFSSYQEGATVGTQRQVIQLFFKE